MRKRIYMGTDDFAKIRSNPNYLYVDKSLLVKEFLLSEEDASLILRPRRFGKSLNFSMLYEFFSNRRGLAVGMPNLFTGLKISEDTDFCEEHQNKYPVIFISLKGLAALSKKELIAKVKLLIADLYTQYADLLPEITSKAQRQNHNGAEFERKYTTLMNSQSEDNPALLETSLHFLSECLEMHYNQKVIILIDEYDAVLNFAWRGYCRTKRVARECGRELSDEEHEQWHSKIAEINTFVRYFLGAALKGNTHLSKGLMTGIYPMTKRESASDLNNVQVYSLLDETYNRFFGFTEEELNWVQASVESRIDPSELKNWYNGYQGGVGTLTRLYNPWSVLTCLKRNKVRAYWEETGNHDLIHDHVLEDQDDAFRKAVAKLSQGEAVECRLNPFINFEQEEKGYESIMTTLFYTGYLTVEGEIDTRDEPSYLLRAPNKEILNVYNRVIQEWLKTKLPPTQYEVFLSHLLKGKVKSFAVKLNDFLLQSAGFFMFTKEMHYNIFVSTLLCALKETHDLYCDSISSGHGRPDALILPKNSRYHYGFILEYKYLKSVPASKEQDTDYIGQKLKNLVLTGLRQIRRCVYDAQVSKFPHIRKTLQVSLAFYKKHVVIAGQKKNAKTKDLSAIKIYFPNGQKETIRETAVRDETANQVIPITSAVSFFYQKHTRKRTAEEADILRDRDQDEASEAKMRFKP